ncbi:hypothetical protein [Fusobacterium nucleatum]|uniref:hypothetical protein n=2 Tax=Fusobacterium nucleatum TaxID=851 RepID=UPI0006CB0F98|nr:hypothetical protein RN95_04780 [Fusobacterium nucleatum subsp. nucleatum]
MMDKEAKDDNKEIKIIEDNFQNNNKTKDDSKIIKIGIAVLIVLLCLSGGYFTYLKFMINKESEDFVNNTVTEEALQETPQEVQIVWLYLKLLL